MALALIEQALTWILLAENEELLAKSDSESDRSADDATALLTNDAPDLKNDA